MGSQREDKVHEVIAGQQEAKPKGMWMGSEQVWSKSQASVEAVGLLLFFLFAIKDYV